MCWGGDVFVCSKNVPRLFQQVRRFVSILFPVFFFVMDFVMSVRLQFACEMDGCVTGVDRWSS